jgi:SRSO17 transposase
VTGVQRQYSGTAGVENCQLGVFRAAIIAAIKGRRLPACS